MTSERKYYLFYGSILLIFCMAESLLLFSLYPSNQIDIRSDLLITLPLGLTILCGVFTYHSKGIIKTHLDLIAAFIVFFLLLLLMRLSSGDIVWVSIVLVVCVGLPSFAFLLLRGMIFLTKGLEKGSFRKIIKK